jgi:hypothetical protein
MKGYIIVFSNEEKADKHKFLIDFTYDYRRTLGKLLSQIIPPAELHTDLSFVTDYMYYAVWELEAASGDELIENWQLISYPLNAYNMRGSTRNGDDMDSDWYNFKGIYDPLRRTIGRIIREHCNCAFRRFTIDDAGNVIE